MNFLAPLFALGALAVVGPILFHLIRRTTRDVTPFSTLMFLDPTPPRITRRSRLENIGLLLLRCAVLALLALGFSRPFFRSLGDAAPRGAGVGKRTVLLVDTSASMRREKLWSDAQKKVAAWLAKATPVDEVAIVTFDRSMRTVVSFEDWNAIATGERAANAGERLAAVSPGWAATWLDSALLHAAEVIEQPEIDSPKQREIVLISDLQEGSRVAALQGAEWPRGLEVVLDPVRASHVENAAVQWISETDEADKPAEETPLRLRVTNAAEAKHEQFELHWNGAATAKLDAYVPHGQSRIVQAPRVPAGSTALTLTGDDTDFDNSIHILTPQPAQMPVLFIGADGDDDPRGSLNYLRRAFPPTRRQHVEITAHRGEEAVPGFQLQQAQLAILGDKPSEAAIASARQFAREGRIVVAPLTSASSAIAVARLLEISTLPATEASVKDYALLAQIDFQHPLFAPFADPRFSDFTKIHTWKYRRLNMAPLRGARVVAAFDSGDPAIVQMPLGKGSVVIFTTSWRPADSQLALSSKFVPLVNSLLEQSSNLPAQKAQFFIGDEVPLPPGPQPLTIRKPDGSEVAAAAGAKFTATDLPGIYSVTPGTLRFVVNLAPDESRLTPLTPDRFKNLGVPLRSETVLAPGEVARRAATAQAVELESRQKLWRWLIVAALGVLLLETLLARKLSRPHAGSTATAT